ncbi:MAG: TIGR03905 family TSCPD domain-containing protein [Eubacterium sp.]|nr:TIGR03905 family TSCPD domain-containing protein [Eubacterium sp.]
MQYTYSPTGICANTIIIDINDDETINEVRFVGGCHGNTQGVAALAKGRNIDEVIESLKGIDCRGRGTSCPDQLAKALELIKEEF